MQHLKRVFVSELNKALKTVAIQCFVDVSWVKYGLLGGSMVANKIALIPLNVCGV